MNDPLTCRICGKPVKMHKSELRHNYEGYSWIDFECLNDKCKVSIMFMDITEAEAIARYQRKPESAWQMLERLKKENDLYFHDLLRRKMNCAFRNDAILSLLNCEEQEALSIMQQIEKELEKQ